MKYSSKNRFDNVCFKEYGFCLFVIRSSYFYSSKVSVEFLAVNGVVFLGFCQKSVFFFFVFEGSYLFLTVWLTELSFVNLAGGILGISWHFMWFQHSSCEFEGIAWRKVRLQIPYESDLSEQLGTMSFLFFKYFSRTNALGDVAPHNLRESSQQLVFI